LLSAAVPDVSIKLAALARAGAGGGGRGFSLRTAFAGHAPLALAAR